MSLAKKSVKWLVAAFVILALVLTAFVAVMGATTAYAEPEQEPDDVVADVTVTAVDSAASGGTFPNLIATNDQERTLTVYYTVDISEESTTSIKNAEFYFAPKLTLGQSTVSATKEPFTFIAAAV